MKASAASNCNFYAFYADMRLKEVYRKAQLDADAAERYRQQEQDHLQLKYLEKFL
jgi:hypothetical protein